MQPHRPADAATQTPLRFFASAAFDIACAAAFIAALLAFGGAFA